MQQTQIVQRAYSGQVQREAEHRRCVLAPQHWRRNHAAGSLVDDREAQPTQHEYLGPREHVAAGIDDQRPLAECSERVGAQREPDSQRHHDGEVEVTEATKHGPHALGAPATLEPQPIGLALPP